MIRAVYVHPTLGALYLVRGSWCVYRDQGHEREIVPVDDQVDAWREYKKNTSRGGRRGAD